MAVLLSRSDLERLLDVQSVIEAVQQAFADYSAGKVQLPVRTAVRVSDPPGLFLLMPCAMTESRALGTKLVSVYPDNPARGLPTIGALYVLSDYETGFPLAVMDATFITALRTAAASAVATRFLAHEDARTLGIFGTGVQAEFHAIAIPSVRPIDRVVVWGRSRDRAEDFVARVQGRAPTRLEPGESPEAVASADVVVTGTTATQPLFPGDVVRPGAHVNGVGSHTPAARELDAVLVGRSRVVVDTYEAAFAEAGDLLLAIDEGQIDRQHVTAEMGEVILGQKPGRQGPDEITLFKSCGVAFEDVVTARLAADRARQAGLGQEFEFGS